MGAVTAETLPDGVQSNKVERPSRSLQVLMKTERPGRPRYQTTGSAVGERKARPTTCAAAVGAKRILHKTALRDHH